MVEQEQVSPKVQLLSRINKKLDYRNGQMEELGRTYFDRWRAFTDSKTALAESLGWDHNYDPTKKVTDPQISRLIRVRNKALKKGEGWVVAEPVKQALQNFEQQRKSWQKSNNAHIRYKNEIDKLSQVSESLDKGDLTSPAVNQLLEKAAKRPDALTRDIVNFILPLRLAQPVVAENIPPAIPEIPARQPNLLVEKHPLRAKLRHSFEAVTGTIAGASLKRVISVGALGGLLASSLVIGYEVRSTSVPQPVPIRQEIAEPPSAAAVVPVATPEAISTPEPLLPNTQAVEAPRATATPVLAAEVLIKETPLRYKQVIIEAAKEYDVPPWLLSALLWQESRFNPKALSPKGSKGIAQMEDATAKMLGVDPWDDMAAIKGAAKYLAYLYKQFGNWPETLAAYNAGEGTVAEYQGIPPYPETEAYVKSILSRQASINQPKSGG